MNHLVRILILSSFLIHISTAQDKFKRSIFSWGASKETEIKDSEAIPGYLPAIKVHKYHGVHINPVNGPPIYLPGSNDPQSNEFDQSARLSPEYSSQLDLLKRVVTFLPDDSQLQDYDLTALLPYTDLISEDDLARIQFAVESETPQKQSKLLKLIGFLRYLKELKLKPFKAAAKLGIGLFNKKKETMSNLLHLGSLPVVTTPLPVLPPQTISLPGGYPIHYPPIFPSQFIPNRPSITFPIQSAPPSNDGQPVEQQHDQPQPHPVAPPSGVNSGNRVETVFFGQNQYHTYPQFTPAGTFLAYSQPLIAPPRNDIVEATASFYPYSQPYQSPSSIHPRVQYPGNVESTPTPHKQPLNIQTNLYTEEPYPSKSSNVLTYQATEQPANFHSQLFNGQEKSKKYPLTQADTYASEDLAGSASDNVEKMKENFETVSSREPAVKVREEISQVENHTSESSPKPKVTKLRPVATRPPVYVFPETALESKTKDFESISHIQPFASSSPANESSN